MSRDTRAITVPMDARNTRTFPVGVGVGNDPQVMKVLHGLLINDELSLTILRNDGVKIVYSNGSNTLITNGRMKVVVKGPAVIVGSAELLQENGTPVFAWFFEGGGHCVFEEHGDGTVASFVAEKLDTCVNENVIEVIPCPGGPTDA